MSSNILENPIKIPETVNIITTSGCIELYENIFDSIAAEKIIKEFEDTDNNPLCPINFSKAQIGDGHDGGSIRSNLTMSIYDHKDIYGNYCSCNISNILSFLKEKLSLFVRYYSFKYDVEIAFDEGLQVLKYGPGKQYKPHTDYGPNGAEHRILSGLIYLNPKNYIGGGTHFINFNDVIQPKSPSLALFPSNYAYRHEARPVFDGYKYAIVTWFGPPWMENRHDKN